MRIVKGTCLGLMLVAVVLAAVGAQAEQIKFESLVPADSLVYVALGDMNDLRARFKNSKYDRLWNEPEVQKYVKTLTEKVFEQDFDGDKEASRELKELLKWEELVRLAQGEVAFALISVEFPEPEKEGAADESTAPGEFKPYRRPSAQPVLAFFLDTGAEREEAERLLDKLLDLAPDDAVKDLRHDRFKDVEITHTKPSNDEGVVVQWAFVDSNFVLAVAPSLEKGMHKIIEAYKEPRSIQPLGARSEFRRIYSRLGKNPLFKFMVNIKGLLALAAKADEKASETFMQVFDILGLKELNTFVGGMNIEEENIRCFAFLDVPTAGKKGLLKLLGTKAGHFPTMKLTPANIIEFAAFHHDVPSVYKELTGAFQAAFPEEYPMFMGALRAMEMQMMISIETDIIGGLGSEVGIMSTSGPDRSPETVVLVELKSTEGFQKLIDYAMASTQSMSEDQDKPKSIDFAGYKVHLIPKSGGMQAEGESAPDVKYMGLCLTDKYFVFATSVDTLKTILKRIKSPRAGLEGSEAFNKVLHESGFTLSDAVGVSFSDLQKALDFYLSPQYVERMEEAMIMASFDLEDLFDPKVLPSSETLKKYFNASITVIKSKDDGTLFEAFSY